MNTLEVIAIADNKRIKVQIEIPGKWLAAGQAAKESFCRGWLKVKHKTNSISILAARPVKAVEIKAERVEPTLEQSESFVSTEQSPNTEAVPAPIVPLGQSSKANPETILIVPPEQNSNETLSLF